MPAYRDIADKIKAFLGAADQSMRDDLQEWAREFDHLCRETNARLRQCGEALQQGQRDDAIETANAPPNLMDLVAAVDLPESDFLRWQQICAQYGLPEPPRILMDEAAALNGAYAAAEPLKELMDRYRELSLARAPLRERLNVMRQLATQDPASPHWDEDIRACESVRLEEIRTSAAAMGRSGDPAGLAALAAELKDTPWRVALPPSLAQSVQQSAEYSKAISRLDELQRLAPRIDESHAAMDLAQCEALFDQWQSIAASLGVRMPADLHSRVEPAFQWVAGQREQRAAGVAFAAACQDLQQKLDAHTAPDLLDQSYQAACRFPLDLPGELESRYRQKVAERAAAARRKRILFGSGIAAAFLMVCSIAVIITLRTMRGREIDNALQVLHEANGDVDGGNPDAADRTASELVTQHPAVTSDAAVTQAMDELKASIAAERQRKKDFTRLLNAANDAGVDHPDTADLQAAAAIAKLPDEKSAVNDLQSDIASHAHSQQAKTDADFLSQCQALVDNIDRTLSSDLLERDPDAYQKQFDAFTDQKKTLSENPNVSESMRNAQIALVTAKLGEKRASLNQVTSEQQALQSVTNFDGTVASHVDSLKQFIARCPDSARDADFARELDHIPPEQAVESWGQLVAPWKDQPVPENQQAATDRLAAVNQYLKNYPDSPMAQDAGKYVTYLKLGLAAIAPDGPVKKDLGALLTNPLIHDLQTVEDAQGTVYYVMAGPDWKVKREVIANETVGEDFPAIISPDPEKPTTLRLTRDDGALLKSETPSPSPQAQCAAKVLTAITEYDFKGFETFGPTAIANVMAQKNLHPVLRGILVESIIQSVQPTFDWAGDTAEKHVADELATQKIDDMQWLDPKSQPSQDALDAINNALKDLPSAENMKKMLTRQVQIACAPLNMQFGNECVLLKKGDQFSLSSHPGAQAEAAFTVDGSKLVEVARAADGKWVFDPDAAGRLHNGQLVFLSSLPH